MAQVNFRIDDETKERADELFKSLGMTMSGAITIFITQSLNYQGLPFPIRKPDASARPMEELLNRIEDYRNGQKDYHFHDLIEVDDDPPAKKRARPRKPSSRSRRIPA